MVIYGVGFAAVFFMLALMYWQAYKKRESLELNELEIHRTRHSLVDHCAMAGVGLISALLALVVPEQMVGSAGFVYFVIGIYHSVAGAKFGKQDRLILERMRKSAVATS